MVSPVFGANLKRVNGKHPCATRFFLCSVIFGTIRLCASLLRIIANSMLAVTTFSLTVMVSVHRAASQQWTPRVHRLMMEDKTTNNTLSTLVGAFIYALASIVLLETLLFTDDQVVVLFSFTILILILIVIAIVRWIVHLQTLGSLIEVTRRIEAKAIEAFRQRLRKPCLGGHRFDAETGIPESHEAFTAGCTGYVQYIYEEQLSDLADKQGTDIYVTTAVGAFVYAGTPIAHLGSVDEETRKVLIDSIAIGDLRTFEQDARFGLIVMAEIASKALSPGINDAGTAIDVLGRLGRIFENYPTEDPTPRDGPAHPRLYMPALDAADLVEDAFDPIARDGAQFVEVQLALQAALGHLAEHKDKALADAAKAAAQRAYRRAEAQMTNTDDLDRLRQRIGREIMQGA